MKEVISIRDFSRQDFDALIKEALKRKKNRITTTSDKKVASLFFENSTRTRVSSETASHNLGIYINGFAGAEGTSVIKGEPLADSVRMFEVYGYDAIIMRHKLEGAARFASDNLSIPLINGGDGSGSHPTQTMLDLMTIKEAMKNIDGLKIAMVGDLKNGRTVHSLLQALKMYDVKIWLVSPKNLSMPQWRIDDYEKPITFTEDLMKAIRNVDVLYMTRIQRERFPAGPEGDYEYQKVSGIYNLNAEMLKKAKDSLIVMHPLPRYKYNLEISLDVDKTKHAKYLEQAKNGLYMREAILARVFGQGFKKQKSEIKERPIWKDLEIKDGRKKGENFLYRIDNGTLIDHIEPGKGNAVMKVLGLDKYRETPMIYAKNLRSTNFGIKDVIGIKDKELSKEELSKLALVSSNATINIIRNSSVHKKGKVILPNVLKELIKCNNLRCISRTEHAEHVPSKFYVENRDELKVRCHYCEKPMMREEIELLNLR